MVINKVYWLNVKVIPIKFNIKLKPYIDFTDIIIIL